MARSLLKISRTTSTFPSPPCGKRIGDTIVVSRSGSREGEQIELNQITLRVDDVDNVMHTADLVQQTLEPTHGRAGDTAIIVPKELLDQARNTRIMFIVFMGVIAGVSLVVGGIGIMNIMLATVTERTREIGIRRALGAKRADIIRQFLVETVVLSALGGITGIILGYSVKPGVYLLRMFAAQVLPQPDRQSAGGGARHGTDHRTFVDPLGLRHRGCHWRRVRHLSGHPRRTDGSDRSLATRVAGSCVSRVSYIGLRIVPLWLRECPSDCIVQTILEWTTISRSLNSLPSD